MALEVENPFTQEQITTGLMALIAWAGNTSAASRYLRDHKDLIIKPSTLTGWKRVHGLEYDELRDKYMGQLEGNLINELRDLARLSVETERLAIEKAHIALTKNEDRDPGRTAANLARVTQSSVDKVLSLSGRPTTITESRGAQELIRSLAQMGVIKIPDAPAPAEIEEVSDESIGRQHG